MDRGVSLPAVPPKYLKDDKKVSQVKDEPPLFETWPVQGKFEPKNRHRQKEAASIQNNIFNPLQKINNTGQADSSIFRGANFSGYSPGEIMVRHHDLKPVQLNGRSYSKGNIISSPKNKDKNLSLVAVRTVQHKEGKLQPFKLPVGDNLMHGGYSYVEVDNNFGRDAFQFKGTAGKANNTVAKYYYPLVLQRVEITRENVSEKVFRLFNTLNPLLKDHIRATDSMDLFFKMDPDNQVLFLQQLQQSLPVLDRLIHHLGAMKAIAGLTDIQMIRPDPNELRQKFMDLNPEFLNQFLRLFHNLPAVFRFYNPEGNVVFGINSFANFYQPNPVKMIKGPEEDLVDLMMRTGSMNDLLDNDMIVLWPDLAAELASFYDPDYDGDYLDCGKLRLAFGEQATFESNPQNIVPGLQNKLSIFLLNFMKANGQLSYIYNQDWFKGGWKILIDINFYANRELPEKGLGLHKDTAGQNLFVNLIFRNENPTPATEWTQDREIPDQVRLAELQSLLPLAVLAKIGEAKKQLQLVEKEGKGRFEGGIAPRNAYVSWVDELVWHSSPSLKKRSKFDKGTIQSNFDHPDLNFEAMIVLSQKHGTLLNKVFGHSLRDFTYAVWKKYYDSHIFHDGIERDKLWEDISAMDWEQHKSSGAVGQVLDQDIKELLVPTMVQGRPRANSIDDIQKKVKVAAAQSPTRSFIRTWVTIVKK